MSTGRVRWRRAEGAPVVTRRDPAPAGELLAENGRAADDLAGDLLDGWFAHIEESLGLEHLEVV